MPQSKDLKKSDMTDVIKIYLTIRRLKIPFLLQIKKIYVTLKRLSIVLSEHYDSLSLACTTDPASNGSKGTTKSLSFVFEPSAAFAETQMV